MLPSVVDSVVHGGKLQNLQLARASGSDDRGHVSDLFSHQGAADRRGGRNHALGDIAFFAGHQFVDDFFILSGIKDHQSGAQGGAIAGNIRQIHERQLAHALFHHAQAGTHELLALLGHVVLGIFREVAHRDRFFKLGRKFMI